MSNDWADEEKGYVQLFLDLEKKDDFVQLTFLRLLWKGPIGSIHRVYLKAYLMPEFTKAESANVNGIFFESTYFFANSNVSSKLTSF